MPQSRKSSKSGKESVNSCGDRQDLCQNLGIAHSSSHFQVELKSSELFQRFCNSLAPRPEPAQKYELSHGTCIHPGPIPPRRCPAELMAFTARGQPEIRQNGRAFGRQPGGVRHKSLRLGSTSVLKMYARRLI